MNDKRSIFCYIVGISALAILFTIPSAYAIGVQIDHTSDWLALPNGTLTPYNLTQTSNTITIQTKSNAFVYNNSTCNFSFYNQTLTTGTPIIPFDNYMVLAELNGTTNWNNVAVINNASCKSEVYQNQNGITISSTKQSIGNGIFEINYTQNIGMPLKISFKAVNQNPSWNNYHVGMSESLAVPRFVSLGNVTYDLSQYNNTSLNRSWITSHMAQLISFNRHFRYEMGLGWNKVNDIVIHYINNQAILEIDYTYNTPILQPNHTILVDPSLDTDTFINTGSSTSATQTISITVGNHANRAIVVGVTMFRPSDGNHNDGDSSVKIGSTSFTKAVNKTMNDGSNVIVTSELWYITNPPTGANTITLTINNPATGGYFMLAGAYSLYNVNQITPIGSTSTSTGTSSPATISINPTTTNSWLIDNALAGGSSVTFSGQSDTSAWNAQYSGTTSVSGASQYKSNPSSGSNTMTHTISYTVLDLYVDTAIEVKSASPTTPTLTKAVTLNSTAVSLFSSSSVGATWYEFNYSTPFEGSTWKIGANQSGTNLILNGLKPNTQYQFEVYAGNSSGISPASNIQLNYTYPFAFFARKADNSTTFAGSIINTNSSKSGTYALASGNYNFTGLNMKNLQNFTTLDSSTMFVTNKTLNVNASRLSLHVKDNDFLVTCPATGSSPALELFTNETQGHHITAFSSPTCYSNGTVKWHVYYTANGNSPTSYYTSVKVQILNSTYLEPPISLKANSTAMSMSLLNPWIVSNNTLVGTGYQTVGIYFNLHLAVNPAYQVVNFTAGFLTLNQSNPVVFPLSFSSTYPTCSETDVKIIYPNNYNLQVNVTYALAQKTITYDNPSSSSAGLGQLQTTFDFKNATKDVITMTASNAGNPAQEATYAVPQNQSCLNQNTNSTIPIIQDIFNFQNGTYGTKGNLGAINLVVLIVLIFSMIGLNRVSETVGMVVMLMILGALATFHIFTWPTVMVPGIALVVLIGVGSSKKLPWS